VRVAGQALSNCDIARSVTSRPWYACATKVASGGRKPSVERDWRIDADLFASVDGVPDPVRGIG
jgi:hypothetical protein